MGDHVLRGEGPVSNPLAHARAGVRLGLCGAFSAVRRWQQVLRRATSPEGMGRRGEILNGRGCVAHDHRRTVWLLGRADGRQLGPLAGSTSGPSCENMTLHSPPLSRAWEPGGTPAVRRAPSGPQRPPPGKLPGGLLKQK